MHHGRREYLSRQIARHVLAHEAAAPASQTPCPSAGSALPRPHPPPARLPFSGTCWRRGRRGGTGYAAALLGSWRQARRAARDRPARRWPAPAGSREGRNDTASGGVCNECGHASSQTTLRRRSSMHCDAHPVQHAPMHQQHGTSTTISTAPRSSAVALQHSSGGGGLSILLACFRFCMTSPVSSCMASTTSLSGRHSASTCGIDVQVLLWLRLKQRHCCTVKT